jgi:predicted NACHT family NTPase
MSQQTYSWKRFWCPLTGSISLADFGYLFDPDSEYGKQVNSDVVPFNAIASMPCLIMLGEAGMGKSTAAKQAYELIKAGGGECLWIGLGDYNSDTDLCNAIFRNSTFQSWLQGNNHLHLFLDSLDEGMLSIQTLVRILKREFDKLSCDRLSLRITCRTADWPDSLEEKLKKKWGEDNVGVYELAPLRRRDVIEAAKDNDLNTAEFIQAIFDREAVPLAIKPITLKFLINTYKQTRQFPPTKRELYSKGCEILCTEINPDRLESGFRGELSHKQRVIVAARIAAIFIFANRSAIWANHDFGDVPSSDVAISELVGDKQIDDSEFQVTDQNIREILSITSLFSSRGNNRMGFAHQTYAEFLAAWYIAEYRKLPLTQILSLLIASEDPERRLVPQLYETAAWIACWRNDVLQEIMKSDPDVILRSDIPTDASVRAAIVDNLLMRYERGIIETFDERINSYRYLEKLSHPNLANQLRPYILDCSKSLEARNRAIDIAEVCKEFSLQDTLADLALNQTEDIYLRVGAASALTKIGESKTRLRLKCLATNPLSEDEDDELKGYSLQAVWPDHLTIEDLFQSLNSPKQRNLFGSYGRFLNTELVKKLKPEDLPVALNWVVKQGLRYFQHPFEAAANTILLFAWENLEVPGVLELFAKIALTQWKEYQKVITESWKPDFEILLLQSDEKRHRLISAIVSLFLEEIEGDPYFLISSTTDINLLANDFFWMMKQMQTTTSESAQEIWAKLIEWSFNRQDAEQIDAIVTGTQSNPILKARFTSYFQAVELASPQAKQMQADYQEMQSWSQRDRKKPRNLSNIEIKERIEYYLNEFESGDLNAWWRLNEEMTLEPDSPYYGSHYETDLTSLYGWQEADTVTRRRILNAASKYVKEQTDPLSGWIGTNTYNLLSLAGCRALHLLLKEMPISLDALTIDIWTRWSPAILAFPYAGDKQEDSYLELIGRAYLNAPTEFIETLTQLIDAEDRNSSCIFITSKLAKCWDNCLKNALISKIKTLELAPKCMYQLLEENLKQNHEESRDFAKSLLSWSSDEERQRAIFAARALLEYSQESNWGTVWLSMQQDQAFGKEVVEHLANRYPRGIVLHLNEMQLADLYIWLEKAYPHWEDPSYDRVHNVGMRECMSSFRDSVLSQLAELGTQKACSEIQRIIQTFPDYRRPIWTLLEAQNTLRRKSWNPVMPSKFFQLVSRSDKRLVKDGLELLEVLIESLRGINIKLQTETPEAPLLWNIVPNSGICRPKDENTFSDYVKQRLDEYLKQRGIIANREVEIRHRFGAGGSAGERTDIHVNAVLKAPNAEVYDSVTVIIEAKGCWHNELNEAMETQLVNRYLKDNTCQYGLYLVGWFNCNQWDASDSRKHKAIKIGSIAEAQERFERQAERLSQAGVTVRAFVLNASLR